jgi:hypothetical protein
MSALKLNSLDNLNAPLDAPTANGNLALNFSVKDLAGNLSSLTRNVVINTFMGISQVIYQKLQKSFLNSKANMVAAITTLKAFSGSGSNPAWKRKYFCGNGYTVPTHRQIVAVNSGNFLRKLKHRSALSSQCEQVV